MMAQTFAEIIVACQEFFSPLRKNHIRIEIEYDEADPGFTLLVWFEYSKTHHEGHFYTPCGESRRLTKLSAREVMLLSATVGKIANIHELKEEFVGYEKDALSFFLRRTQ